MRANIHRGFTFVELIVVGGILAVITGLTIFNLGRLQTQTSASSIAAQVEADIRSQQLSTMNATSGSSNSQTGIYFGTTSYTLFTGSSYDSSDTSNFVVTLPTPWTITTTFNANTILFASGSGEIQGLASGERLVTVSHPDSGASATFYLNKYGTIEEQP